MANQQTTEGKSVHDESSARALADAGSKLGDLLKTVEMGLFVSGIVVDEGASRDIKGTGKNGKPFHFCLRQTQVFAGSGNLVLVDRWNPDETPPPSRARFSSISARVASASMNGGVIEFTLAKETP